MESTDFRKSIMAQPTSSLPFFALLNNLSAREKMVCRLVSFWETSLVWCLVLVKLITEPVVDHLADKIVQGWQCTDWATVFWFRGVAFL